MARNRVIVSKALNNLCGNENFKRNKYDTAYQVCRLVPAIQKLLKKIWIFSNSSSIHEMSVKEYFNL